LAADIIDRMTFADLSDEDLVSAARTARADREAVVNELFARHYERVARWCLRFTGDRESAADLAQDVFLKAHRHLDSFKGNSRFSTWLYTIVRNESLSRLQRQGPPADGDAVLEEIAAIEPAPDELAQRSQRADRLKRFLASTLDALERRVFVLHYGDGMPLEAITRLLRLDNASGAKAYIVSARRKVARATGRLKARGQEL
jgi:RNA polymerase sigma-70 factor (ECF subfamily)